MKNTIPPFHNMQRFQIQSSWNHLNRNTFQFFNVHGIFAVETSGDFNSQLLLLPLEQGRCWFPGRLIRKATSAPGAGLSESVAAHETNNW